MTFFHYWYRITKANPSMSAKGATITLTAEQFEKQVKKAYDQGWSDGVENERRKAPSMFDSIFGKGF